MIFVVIGVAIAFSWGELMKKIVLFGGDIKMGFRLKMATRGFMNLIYWCLLWILLK